MGQCTYSGKPWQDPLCSDLESLSVQAESEDKGGVVNRLAEC